MNLIIESIQRNSSLYEERNFDGRSDAIDFIGSAVIDRLEELLRNTSQPEKLNLLKSRAEKVKSALEEIDINLFRRLRATIRNEGCTGKEFRDLVNAYVGCSESHDERGEETGYDNLDIFINGLFACQGMPQQTKEVEPEMIGYQKTPARIIFELVDSAHFTKNDVFVDLGSGLGQAAILVHLLAGITTKGVEFEPAFCDFAADCAAGLNLSRVTFTNVDARNAGYSEATVFFMFTPFSGDMLQAVLETLRKEALLRKIKIFTYGPCTAEVAGQSWLEMESPDGKRIYTLGVFNSYTLPL